ncbi:hypothetical protein ACGFIY_33490 [Micromonospora chersina]|uniref:hypothetical protein n=1 Tax=Micromonospora chersina TaxID=47854 RepID=UPI00371B24CC
MNMTAPPTVTRRALVMGGLGAAAGTALSLATGGTASAATAALPSYPIWANGHSSTIDFYKRLALSDVDAARKVGGGIAANAYGNPILVYGVDNGMAFSRPLDVHFNAFQIFRHDPARVDASGPGGWFEQYTLDGFKYKRTGSFPWKATAVGQQPWNLGVDTAPRDTYGVTDWGVSVNDGAWKGVLRELHYYDEPSGIRNFWGTLGEASIVGYTLIDAPFSHQTQQSWALYRYHVAPYAFIKALDTNFNQFQVIWGQDVRRYEYTHSGGIYLGMSFQKAGSALQIDTTSGAQTAFKWQTTRYALDRDGRLSWNDLVGPLL